MTSQIHSAPVSKRVVMLRRKPDNQSTPSFSDWAYDRNYLRVNRLSKYNGCFCIFHKFRVCHKNFITLWFHPDIPYKRFTWPRELYCMRGLSNKTSLYVSVFRSYLIPPIYVVTSILNSTIEYENTTSSPAQRTANYLKQWPNAGKQVMPCITSLELMFPAIFSDVLHGISIQLNVSTKNTDNYRQAHGRTKNSQ